MTPQRPKPRVTARRSLHAHRLEGWNRTVFTNNGEILIFMIALTPVVRGYLQQNRKHALKSNRFQI